MNALRRGGNERFAARMRSYEAVGHRFHPDLPFALMDVSIGLLYLFSPKHRISSPSLAIAKDLLNWALRDGYLAIRVWGVIFLVIGIALLVALRSRPQWALTVTRVGGVSLFFMWALMYFLSGLADDKASFAGVPIFLYLSYRHSFAPVRIVDVSGNGA